MATQEGQSNKVSFHDGEEVTVSKTSSQIGSAGEKKKEEVATNMPMSHEDDVFTDWNFAIRG